MPSGRGKTNHGASRNARSPSPKAGKVAWSHSPPAHVRGRWQKLRTRLMPTFVMITSFVGIILAGHFYCMLLVFAIHIALFAEVTALLRDPAEAASVAQTVQGVRAVAILECTCACCTTGV
jgi:hypothetical protein